MTQNNSDRSQGREERTAQPHAQCRKSFKSHSHQGLAIRGAFMHKGRVIHFSDHPLSRVIGEAPGQGAQKRERETLNYRFPLRLFHSLDKQSGCPRLFPELSPSSPASQTLPSLFPGPLCGIRNGHPAAGLHKEPLVL